MTRSRRRSATRGFAVWLLVVLAGSAEPDPDVPLEPDSDGRYVLGRVWKYAEIGP